MFKYEIYRAGDIKILFIPKAIIYHFLKIQSLIKLINDHYDQKFVNNCEGFVDFIFFHLILFFPCM